MRRIQNHIAHSRKPVRRLLPYLLAAGIMLLAAFPALAQQLSLRDQAEIQYQAQLSLLEYESILNLISNEAIIPSVRQDVIQSTYQNPATSIFYAPDVPVANNLIPADTAQAEPVLGALAYIQRFDSVYVKSALETVDFYDFQLSDLRQADYLFLTITYTAHLKGRHSSHPAPYKPQRQQARFRVEKKGDGWVTYIQNVTRHDPNAPLIGKKLVLSPTPNDDGTFAARLAELQQPPDARQQQQLDAAIAQSWKGFDEKRFREISRQAELAENRQAYARAKTYYQQALALQPQDARVKERLNKLEEKVAFKALMEKKLAAGAYLEAIQDYARAIAQDPKNADLYNGRARAYVLLNEPQSALRDFDTALSLDPHFAEALHNRAQLYSSTEQPQKALQDYNQLVTLQPQGPAYYPHRAKLKQAMGDAAGALADYEAAIAWAPQVAAYHYQKGVLLQQQQQHEQAIEAFSAALALDSLLGDAYYARGLAFVAVQNISSAAVDFERARKRGLSPVQTEAINKLVAQFYQAGEKALQQGEANRALQNFINTVLIDPANEAAWVKKGDAHLLLQDHENALQSYTKAIALENASLAYYKRGLVYRQLKDPEAAKSDFERFIPIGRQLLAAAEGKAGTSETVQSLEEIAQEIAESWYRLGNAQLLAGQHADAQLSLESALSINKAHAEALFALGAAQLGLKNYKRAIRDIEKSLKWGVEESPWVYLALGDAYQGLGQTQYAISIYTYILEKVDTRFDPAYLRRADGYKQLQQYAQALQDITAALTLNDALRRDVRLLTGKGLLELQESRYQDAGQTFDQALSVAANDAWALYGKASVLASQNRMEESLDLYRRAFQTGEIEWAAIKDDPIIKEVSKQKAFQELVNASLRM